MTGSYDYVVLNEVTESALATRRVLSYHVGRHVYNFTINDDYEP